MTKSIEISKHVYLTFVTIMATLGVLQAIFPAFVGFTKSLSSVMIGVFITLIILRRQSNKNIGKDGSTKPIEISKHVYLTFVITMAILGLLQGLAPDYLEFIRSLAAMLIGVYITLIVLRIQNNKNLEQSNA